MFTARFLKLPLFLVALLIAVMLTVDFMQWGFYVAIRYGFTLAVVLVLLGVVIVLSSAMTFKKAKTTIDPVNPNKATSLVMSGPFKYSRNPMYLGFL